MDNPETEEEIMIEFEEAGLHGASCANDEFYLLVGASCANGYEVSRSRMSSLEQIMEALADSNIYMMGVCGKDDVHMASLLQGVERRAKRDNLFGMIVTVIIKKEPDLRRIQQQIADQLGLSLPRQGQGLKTRCVFTNSNNNKVIIENARQLADRIRGEPNILFILRDLWSILDLAKLGIPFGMDHQACKFIVTSQNEELLSDQMNTHLHSGFQTILIKIDS